MRAIFILAMAVLVFTKTSFSQSASNDQGAPDTLALRITTPPSEGPNASVVVEAWVYSDETILSFCAGFKWRNLEMRIDSAKASPLLESADFNLYFFQDNNPNIANLNQTFILGGYSEGAGLASYSFRRRHWMTYYFTLNSWRDGDSIIIDILPNDDVEFAFVTPGPFYPLGFQPRFEGPLLFPGITTSVEENEITVPTDFALYQNFPNPFNPETIIEFQIPARRAVELDIFNSIGQRVATLVNENLSPGRHQFSWNSKTDAGIDVPSGVYFYKLRTPDYSSCKKMILIR